jgi:hypothetical protein
MAAVGLEWLAEVRNRRGGVRPEYVVFPWIVWRMT